MSKMLLLISTSVDFHCTQLDYKFHSNHIDRDYLHNTQNDLYHTHNYILYQNLQFHSLYADTFQDWFRCFHNANLPFDMIHMCSLDNI